MFFHSLVLGLVVETFLLATVLGYKIDQSCTQEGIENDIRNAMTSAFEMVDSALARLTASPLDQHTVDLVGNLFAGPGQDPRTAVTAKTVDVFALIRQHYHTETPSSEPTGEDDITIFCNRDRFQLIDKKKEIWLDNSDGVYFQSSDTMCGRSFPKDTKDKLVLAETRNPIRDTGRRDADGNIIYEEKPTAIQLCPWFVAWIKDHKFKLGKDAMSTLIGKTVLKISESKAPFGFAQIDAFALLDKVLLHEMTHGRSVYMTPDQDEEVDQEGLIDATTSGGWLGLGILKASAYGWHNCLSLAKRGDRLGGINAADNNADTLALFGSICKLMDDRNNPRTVDDKGRIIPLV